MARPAPDPWDVPVPDFPMPDPSLWDVPLPDWPMPPAWPALDPSPWEEGVLPDWPMPDLGDWDVPVPDWDAPDPAGRGLVPSWDTVGDVSANMPSGTQPDGVA
jgi:hypothetical protein